LRKNSRRQSDAISCFIHSFDGRYGVAGEVHAVDLDAEVNLPAVLAHKIGNMLPELARAELRIEEFLNERGLCFLLGDVV